MSSATPLPSLMRFEPIYKKGPGAGTWIFEQLSRPRLGIDEATASIEFSTTASQTAEGPLAGTGARELIERHGENFLGLRALAALSDRLDFEVRFFTSETSFSPVEIVPPAPGKGPAPLRAVMVLDTRPGGKIYYGRRRSLGDDRFRTLLMQHPASELLQDHEAMPGQVFVIPAGLPFAYGRGVMGLETSLFGRNRKHVSITSLGPSLVTAPVPGSRLFIKSRGYMEGMNVLTWLHATDSVATARLDLRLEHQSPPRPSLTVLTAVAGKALVTAGEDSDSIKKGESLTVTARAPGFRINPGQDGASIFMTWFPDREAELVHPLEEQGFSRKEIEGLTGFFGAAPK